MHDYQQPSDFTPKTNPFTTSDDSPTHRNVESDTDSSLSNKLYDKPLLYQYEPRQQWQLPGLQALNRTPSASIQSRLNWAAREYSILSQNHKYREPQFV